jgi:3-hydroxyisobutyrate dehydrogenase-like beta-hydroxyacid dehydrogenase
MNKPRIAILGPGIMGSRMARRLLVNGFPLAMIERSGPDRTMALEIFSSGTPGNPLVKAVSARMTLPETAPNFSLRLLGHAIEEGGKVSLELATTTAAPDCFQNCFQKGIAAGHGEKNIAAVVKSLLDGAMPPAGTKH